jgi:hypothetical protein
MLNRSLAVLTFLVAANSLAFAAQSTTAPVPAAPRVHSEPAKAPHHKQRLKKHKEAAKKPATPPPTPAAPPKE